MRDDELITNLRAETAAAIEALRKSLENAPSDFAAQKGRWPITREQRTAVVLTLTGIVIDPNTSQSDQINAFKTLMLAERQNIEIAKMNHTDEHRFDAGLLPLFKAHGERIG